MSKAIQIILAVVGFFICLAGGGGEGWIIGLPLMAWPMWTFFWFLFRAGVKEVRKAFNDSVG